MGEHHAKCRDRRIVEIRLKFPDLNSTLQSPIRHGGNASSGGTRSESSLRLESRIWARAVAEHSCRSPRGKISPQPGSCEPYRMQLWCGPAGKKSEMPLAAFLSS